jgi:hypothetical protein
MSSFSESFYSGNIITFNLTCKAETRKARLSIDKNCTTATGSKIASTLNPEYSYFVT